MIWLALTVLVVGLAMVGAGLARFTRVHPLAIGGCLGLLLALPAFVLAGAMMSDAALWLAAIVVMVGSVPAALGAFLGWLRRDHIDRKRING
jgi:hypothetical protein